jgi:hypothetical protein
VRIAARARAGCPEGSAFVIEPVTGGRERAGFAFLGFRRAMREDWLTPTERDRRRASRSPRMLPLIAQATSISQS